MLTRCMFALLALAALVILFSGSPGGITESEPWSRRLVLVGILSVGIGMAVPWGRWMILVSPGGSLAFVTKLMSWGGASAVPFCLHSRAWLAAGVCMLLPVCAFALWKGRAWAAWPWYVIALGACAISIWTAASLIAYVVLFEVSVQPVQYCLPVVWIACWGGIGLVLVREVTAWRRRLREQRVTPVSPSAN